MTLLIRSFVGTLLSFALVPTLLAQTPPQPSQATNSSTPSTTTTTQTTAPPPSTSTTKAAPPVQSGVDRPAILVPADTDEITTTILLRGLDATPAGTDLEAGLLTSTQQPSLLIRPTVTLAGTPTPSSAQSKDFLTTIKVTGLAAFGDTTAPLLYKGKQVEVLRFSKPGLLAKPPVGDSFIVRQGDPSPSVLLVLENPSVFPYNSVRGRLRFDNQDVCLFAAENFKPSSNPQNGQEQKSKGDQESNNKKPALACNSSNAWTEFNIPQYAQVSLRTDSSSSWFRDPESGYAKTAKRKGWLTLRFQRADSQQIAEQNIPIEVQFEPDGWTITRSLLKVSALLVLGAAFSLVLRVTVPNMKRKSQLKDQLADAGRTISTVSTEVDSNLRVLLRVERRTLDELRTAVWPFGPGYADYAARVEQGLPALNRRIAAVVELDAALIRKKALSEQNVAPTKLEQIEEMLSAASETLKQDLLSDEDWVFVNQRLENAQKLLREPTQTEKDAFEAMLSSRWKAILAHFGDANGNLAVPASLEGMKACFPDASLLPGKGDQSFATWLDAIGDVRADLQLSALNLVWEFQFLLPRVDSPSATPPPDTPSSTSPAGTPPPGAPTPDASAAGKPPADATASAQTTSTTPSNAPASGASADKPTTNAPTSTPSASTTPPSTPPAGTPTAALPAADASGAGTPPSSTPPPTAPPPSAPPPSDLPEKWKTAMKKLNDLLSTPAIDNLREAKRELRQLAEGVSEEDLKNALKAGAATITMDPSIARPDRRMRFSVEFRKPKLNRVAARQLITCHWTFDDCFHRRLSWVKRKLSWFKLRKAEVSQQHSQESKPQESDSHLKLEETGWFVHHYFEKSAYKSVASVTFHDSQGQPIELGRDKDKATWAEYPVTPRPDTRGNENWQRFFLEVTQVGAALLVPLATLASNTINGGTASHWWEIVGLGFGSDTIKNIIVGKDSTPLPK